ncbi:hypothetical protein QT381_07840 [Galbitalea sp. SE-J8]|uniref:hypothetical protein n=1 Tax=Galbitalea sp. SE-J8 TaxID=3054952 RepID=UPI00259CB343|nr:hypothetical protein [Galbitalea sp. SE-J8]MDM4762915.1 hypothetical protein [Galbitalea sp. SE-J8]
MGRMLLALSVIALVLAQTAPDPAAVAASVALLAVAGLGIRAVLATPSARAVTVGARSRAHAESVAWQVEPAHPDTAGRTRSRAPGRRRPAA